MLLSEKLLALLLNCREPTNAEVVCCTLKFINNKFLFSRKKSVE